MGRYVMRYTPIQDPSRDPRPTHSIQRTAVGAVLATLAIPAIVMAIRYPVVAVGIVALALGAWLLCRTLRQRYRARQRDGRTWQVSVPKTGISVEI
jgi:hypothetical protein